MRTPSRRAKNRGPISVQRGRLGQARCCCADDDWPRRRRLAGLPAGPAIEVGTFRERCWRSDRSRMSWAVVSAEMSHTRVSVQSDCRLGRRQTLHPVLLGIVLVAGLLVPAVPTAAEAGARRAQRAPGAVVRPCRGRKRVLCGSIEVPLYWSAPRRGSLHVQFKVFLHSDLSLPPLEPIVAMEGGPGYPSTGSALSYLFMIGSLARRHDLILMDQRGTGRSDAIDCPGVQDYDALARPGGYPAVVAACAGRLGKRANAYGSAAVAEDLRAVLEAVHVSKSRSLRRLLRQLRRPGFRRPLSGLCARPRARRHLRRAIRSARARGGGSAASGMGHHVQRLFWLQA